nr:hypothetical protein CPGR_05155 [Mycolicibacterium malmesburyense]
MPRSAPRVAWATRQPSFSAPIRLAAGIETSLRKISQKCESPIALRMGRTSTPGVVMSSRKYEMPFRFGASGSVRASSRHQSACLPPLAQSFWPLTTYESPSLRAVVRRLARSDPASGSEKPWTQISPSRIAGKWRWRCSSVPAINSVEAAWWIPTKASTSRGASCAANSWYSTTCSGTDMPPPHSAGQCGTAKPALCSSANHCFWKATNCSSLAPVWVSRQFGGMCSTHHCRTCCRN